MKRRYIIRKKYVLKILLVVGLIFVTGVFSISYFNNEQEDQRIVNTISELVILPENETPTIAEVTDPAKLKDQSFFANAKKGDQVLIYPKAQLSVLYRPAVKKVVSIGPTRINPFGVSSETFNVEVRVGTTNTDVENKMISKLHSAFPQAKVIATNLARRNDYPETIIIDLKSGSKEQIVSKVAQATGTHVGILPIGEAKADADILIIVGKDFQ